MGYRLLAATDCQPMAAASQATTAGRNPLRFASRMTPLQPDSFRSTTSSPNTTRRSASSSTSAAAAGWSRRSSPANPPSSASPVPRTRRPGRRDRGVPGCRDRPLDPEAGRLGRARRFTRDVLPTVVDRRPRRRVENGDPTHAGNTSGSISAPAPRRPAFEDADSRRAAPVSLVPFKDEPEAAVVRESSQGESVGAVFRTADRSRAEISTRDQR